MPADESSPNQQPTPQRALLDSIKRITRTFIFTIVLALALLSFPSVLPWMVACWLAGYTILARRHRPAWLPLVACLLILIVKLVPPTPAMITLCGALLVVGAGRFHHRHDESTRNRWWRAALVVWIAWSLMVYERRKMEACDRPLTLDVSRPVVCLGDSLTQGLLPDQGYPEQLKEMVRMPVVNLGFSGISTSQGLGQLPRVLDHDPQVVVIELGGHDFLNGKSRTDTKRNLEEMIVKCRDRGADVVLMEIPRGFIFDPFARLERELAYEHDVQLIPDTCLRQIVIMSPVTPPGMWMPDAQLSDDGIHSNPRGSKAIAQRVAEALRSMYGNAALHRGD